MDIKNIKRAIISVSDKSGVLDLARALKDSDVEILSTGGTAKFLADGGVEVTNISDFTGFPEILSGRVKTLHPKIHGGILGNRSDEDHLRQMDEHNIKPIDMIVVNLYPFEQTVAKKQVTEKDAIENIDIGGPAMIRAASKNFLHVAVVTDPADYPSVIEAVNHAGGLSLEQRRKLAVKAFGRTSEYDAAIHAYLSGTDQPDSVRIEYKRCASMRYGENPHQSAAFYVKSEDVIYTGENQLHGKELSYNNIVDLDAALQHVREYSKTACVITKHTNPCGAALDIDQTRAFINARDCDPASAFGSVIGFNNTVTVATAMELSKLFVEAVIAPEYEDEAFSILKRKKNLRLIKPRIFRIKEKTVFKNVTGGLLAQSPDNVTFKEADLKVVTKRTPTDEEMKSLKFAWTVSKHVKSNAIVYVRDSVTVGVGAGQMSRVDSAAIAASKAQSSLKGCVMASDAFFPFRDGIDAAGKEGIAAVIQPGGSIRDDEIIEAADEHGMAMVFTGIRHFRH
ncbi:MAG: bifunctional purine biosynthesis protein PurH [bacterium]|nr:MAG: bifunctional purine biosynthesis protein PurH [bacterium]